MGRQQREEQGEGEKGAGEQGQEEEAAEDAYCAKKQGEPRSCACIASGGAEEALWVADRREGYSGCRSHCFWYCQG